ncbi:MAG TPA: phospholipase [Solirubrobacteraceae bacterium]
MSGLDDLVHRVREPAGEAQGALVLLHGRGTSEDDLFPLLDHLDPDRRLLGVTPRGPLALPPGGAHWYAVRRVGYPDPPTFEPAWATLQGWFDALPVPPERTIVGGFSQGSVMAYALGLAAGRPRVAGIIALSGFIPTVESLELDLTGRAGLPVAIGHGTYDPVIPVQFGRDARERLTQAGLDVTFRESAMDHTIDPRVLAEVRDWMPL